MIKITSAVVKTLHCQYIANEANTNDNGAITFKIFALNGRVIVGPIFLNAITVVGPVKDV